MSPPAPRQVIVPWAPSLPVPAHLGLYGMCPFSPGEHSDLHIMGAGSMKGHTFPSVCPCAQDS